MLLNCTFEHFKSVYERVTLPLKPLTVFAGPNSSGKSTVIQGVLLTTQTLQNPVSSRSVVLNGHMLKLGEFSDVLSQNAKSPQITLGFSLAVKPDDYGRPRYYVEGPATISRVACEYRFSAPAGLQPSATSPQLQPQLDYTRIDASESPEGSTTITLSADRSNLTTKERLERLKVPPEVVSRTEAISLDYETHADSGFKSVYSAYQLPTSSRPAGATMFHFLPDRLSMVYDTINQEEEQLVRVLTNISSGHYVGWMTEPGIEIDDAMAMRLREVILPILQAHSTEVSSLPHAYQQRALDELIGDFSVKKLLEHIRRYTSSTTRRQLVSRLLEQESALRSAVRGGRANAYSLALIPLPPALDSAVQAAKDFFARKVKYLGPLRDEPRAVYPLAGGADPNDIGYRGEHTAAVLDTNRHTQITYYPIDADGDRVANEQREGTLEDAVLDWLQYMGIAGQFDTSDKGILGHGLKVSVEEGDALHDLTHVGVGVSQVLPILVLALLADQGSTLIFEQPELHLHPRVQTRLADFFVSMTRLGKQCLVETHSEYLISRLRLQAALSDDDWVSTNTLLYFVKRRSGHSDYRPVTINQYGVIEEWPEGFFDETETLAAAILRAGMTKRRSKDRLQK